MFVERGTSTRRFSSHDKAARTFRAGIGAWRSRASLIVCLLVCLPTLLIGLGAGEGLNLAYGQSESNAVVSTAQSSSREPSREIGVSAQFLGGSVEATGSNSRGADTRKSLRERSEPTVTGAAMHIALFVPRN